MRWLSALLAEARKLVSFPARWARSLWIKPKPQLFRSARVEDMPDSLKSLTVYLCGEGENLWAAAMICPCGCGDVIQLNLLKRASPCWRAVENPDGTVSVMPSIWRKKATFSSSKAGWNGVSSVEAHRVGPQ
jgi:hypothetical protein